MEATDAEVSSVSCPKHSRHGQSGLRGLNEEETAATCAHEQTNKESVTSHHGPAQ